MVTETPAATTTRRVVVVIGILTVVGFVLRFVAFKQSFFGDELFTYEISTRSGLNAVLDGVRSDLEITPPLFFIIAWSFQHLGDPFTWLRVPSLIAGVVTIPCLYVLGRQTVGTRAALVGTTLFVLNPFAIFYGSEARAYGLMMLLVVLTTLATLRAVERGSWWWWITVGLLVAATMYTHYTAVFVLAVVVGWAFVTAPDQRRRIVAVCAGAALLYVPWIPQVIADHDAPAQKVIGRGHPFGVSAVVHDVQQLIGGTSDGSLDLVPGRPARVLFAAAVLIGVSGLVVRSVRRRPGSTISPRIVLVALLACATPVGAAVYSGFGDDVFAARNLLASLPALCLLFGALFFALPRPAATVAVSLALIGSCFAAASTLQPDARRPDYAAVAHYLDAEMTPTDVILEYEPITGPPGRVLEVNLHGEHPVFTLRGKGPSPQAVAAASRTGGRIFVVRSDAGIFHDLAPAQVKLQYTLVSHRTWAGQPPLAVDVYQPQ